MWYVGMKRYSLIVLGLVCTLWAYVFGRILICYPCNHGLRAMDLIPYFSVLACSSVVSIWSVFRTSFLALVISVAGFVAMPLLDEYNVMVSYEEWTSRGMPDIFTKAELNEYPHMIVVSVVDEGFIMDGCTYTLDQDGKYDCSLVGQGLEKMLDGDQVSNACVEIANPRSVERNRQIRDLFVELGVIHIRAGR